jgi:hypothetical protein
VGGGGVNEGDEGEGIWLMDFIYLYEIEPKKPLTIVLSGAGRKLRGQVMGVI